MTLVIKAPIPTDQPLAGQPSIADNGKIALSARPIRFLQPRTINEVTWVRVDNGGSGYAVAPTVSFTGGGATVQATAVARVRGGVVQCVAVLTHGSGYTSAPTVVFTPVSGGSGASATAIRLDPLSFAQAASSTDLVWYYPGGNTAMGNAFLAAGISVQESINGLVDRIASPSAAAVSWDGQPVPVAWLMPSERAFGASRRSGYLALKRAEAAALTSGTAAHFDDPVPDLSALRARDTSRTGGPFDAETLAGFNPSYVSVMQAVPITQDVWNWTTKAYATTTSNWPSAYNTAPNWAAFVAHLRAGGVALHLALRDAYPSAVRYVSGNTYDPMPRIDYSGYLVRAFDAGMFETDADTWSTRVVEGTPVDYAQRYTRLWTNIKTVTGTGAGCMPHLQPMRNDETYTSTRAQRIAVLLQQYALSWALGGRPLYPCDTYLEPWTAGQNERWFAEPTDGFLPLAALPKDYPFLFDGTRDNGALMLACDVDTNDNRAVNSSGIFAWAETCLRNAVPAIIYPLNAGYTRNPAAEAAAFRIIDCSTPSPVTAALSNLPNYRTIAAQPTTTWAQWSVARLSGTFTDVFVIPRTKNGATVLHIVNMDGVTRAGLTLAVQQWALPNRQVSRVRWFEPGLAPQELSTVVNPTGLSLTLPTLSTWAVVFIEA